MSLCVCVCVCVQPLGLIQYLKSDDKVPEEVDRMHVRDNLKAVQVRPPHIHTHTHTHMYLCTPTPTHSHTHLLLSHRPPLSPTHTHSYTHTQTHTHTYTHTHTHTLTLIHTHTHPNTPKHTHTPPPPLIQTLSKRRINKLELTLIHWRTRLRSKAQKDATAQRPVTLRKRRQQIKTSDNWPLFYYQFSEDHSKASLIWNYKVYTCTCTCTYIVIYPTVLLFSYSLPLSLLSLFFPSLIHPSPLPLPSLLSPNLSLSLSPLSSYSDKRRTSRSSGNRDPILHDRQRPVWLR